MTNLPVSGKTLGPQVLRVLEGEKISLEELDEMVKKSAITTHPRGNRRFHGWVFDISGNQLQHMSKAELVTLEVKGSMELVIEDLCPHCDGDGCKTCGWAGEARIHYQAPPPRAGRRA